MRNSMTQQRRFTKEFEEEAVRLAQTSGRTQREVAVLWSNRDESKILADRRPLHNSGMMKLPLPDEQPIAVNALRRTRAKITGEIELHTRELDQLRATLIHINATLWLFDPETDPNDIPALRRYPRRTEWFARGEVTRRLYEACREEG